MVNGIGLIDNDRHTVMYRHHQFIRRTGDDREGMQIFSVWRFPASPDTGEAQHGLTLQFDEIRITCCNVPFKEAIGWHQTAALGKVALKFCRYSFGARIY